MDCLIAQAKLMIMLNQIGINYFPTAAMSMVTEFSDVYYSDGSVKYTVEWY